MNRIRISKSIYESMKGVYGQGYSKEMFLEAVMCNRNKFVAEKGTHLYLFVKETRYYNTFEIVDIIKGLYEIEYSKEEQVVNAYKEHKKMIKTSQLISNRHEGIGFVKAINFINILYKLDLELEEN